MTMFPWIPTKYHLTVNNIFFYEICLYYNINIYIDVLNIICEKNNYPPPS